MPQVLNTSLYAALQQVFGDVRISNCGVPRLVNYRPNPLDPTQVYANVTQRGQQFRVSCPFCGDRRHRLYVSYEYGAHDSQTAKTNYSLWCCHNNQCHKQPANQARFRALTAIPLGRRERRHASATAPEVVTDCFPPPPIELPTNCIPLDRLTGDHPAIEYLRARHFDPAELARLWDVRYVPAWSPQAANRILIPIRRLQHQFSGGNAELVLAGWQARYIGQPLERVPKYLFPCDFQKAKVVYGLPEAKQTAGPVIVCEGTTDAWRIGPGAVALFGKSLSHQQKLLLVHHFQGRPLIVLFDDDAVAEGQTTARELRLARAFQAGDNRVIVARLPAGRVDPGECTREEISTVVMTALA